MRTTIDPGIDRPTIFLLDHIVYSHVQNLGGQPLDLDLSLMLPLQNNGEMRRIFGNNQPEERPDATIFLIGRTLPGGDLSHLKQYKNIVFHGLVPQPELPAYLAQMDVCLNVFRAGALSKDVSPLKFYEYLPASRSFRPVSRFRSRISGMWCISHMMRTNFSRCATRRRGKMHRKRSKSALPTASSARGPSASGRWRTSCIKRAFCTKARKSNG